MTMDLNLEGKVAIVTGAAHSVGREIARSLAQEGARVALTYLSSAEAASEVQTELENLTGERPLVLRVDVTDATQTEELVRVVEDSLGPVNILVNNAGYNEQLQHFWETSADEWQRSLDVFTFGAMNCCHAVLPSMMRQQYGRIINMVGDAGKMGEVYRSVTAAARGGTMAFTKSLARETGRYGITVNAVSLGLIEDPRRTAGMDAGTRNKILRNYTIRRFGKPQDVAPMVVLLASERSSWITGQIISVSGGYSMV